MEVIVVASRKGGAGKSMLAAHLSVQADRAGDGPVAIVDADEMGGTADWFNERQQEGKPHFLKTERGQLKQALQNAEAAGIRLVVIDTPPAETTALENIMKLANLLIIPVIPSPSDLRTVDKTLVLARKAAKPFMFVLNSAGINPRAKMTKQAAKYLLNLREGRIATTTISTLTDYRSSMIDGRVAVEINPTGRSAEEISYLWMEISTVLNEGRKKRGTSRSRSQ